MIVKMGWLFSFARFIPPCSESGDVCRHGPVPFSSLLKSNFIGKVKLIPRFLHHRVHLDPILPEKSSWVEVYLHLYSFIGSFPWELLPAQPASWALVFTTR